MQKAVTKIVIVGGGTAGWITAGLIAAEHNADNGRLSPSPKLDITLIESPDVPTIGVGEGTWPSMRSTLQKIGIDETTFLLQCDASFKQGSRFIDWQETSKPSTTNNMPNGQHSYLHPFSLPIGEPQFAIAPFWLPHKAQISFADAVCQQNQVSQHALAPKQISTSEYSFINNYGYHLNAGKFSQLLQQHCTKNLAVKHIIDHVTDIVLVDETTQTDLPKGDISHVLTQQQGQIHADLFIDCTGVKSLLLGEKLAVPFINQKHVLFNDSALAIQVPYAEDNSPIASCTHSTAQTHGWIWDIGLPSRRGVGHVYSSSHTNDEQALQQLMAYLKPDLGEKAADISPRKLNIAPGHHQICWKNNCVAVGMAAGFIEPLEASALALVEWTAKAVATQLPPTRGTMDTIAKRVNQQFQHHWQQIIEFLKLHYVISNRSDSDYWHDHRAATSIPDALTEQLALWRHQAPSQHDFIYREMLFPAASYQFVLYGMQFETQPQAQLKPSMKQQAQQLFTENIQRISRLRQVLPTNRALLNQLKLNGFSKI
ncbi:tryptophan halogenase family protein [Shewanella subflava]|uniref:Tryptophan 7-halogenase n=1 Tax=Shewanella subflava TaxID=2986476 RepID=A0ABT3IDQ6_9GAMM|nr:tryptophan halogenase family protein [Shewanella subflava]MCW3174095.1 tryptophan 7-halogenase [Shewanella subflava]